MFDQPSRKLAIDDARLLTDFPYYAYHLMWVKSKSEGMKRFALNNAQLLCWGGQPPDYHTNPRYRFAVIPELGWKHRLAQGGAIRDVILKYRQGGISTLTLGLDFWQIHTHFGRSATVIAHDRETSEHLLEIAKTFHTMMPGTYRPHISSNNSRQLVFATPIRGGENLPQFAVGGLRSSMTIETAGHMGSGHGRTNHILISSETARYPNAEAIMDGLIETVPKGVDRAGTAVLFESTAEVASDYFHAVYQKARTGGGEYNAIFLPWYLCEWYELPCPKGWEFTKEQREMQQEFTLTDNQLFWYWEEAVKGEDQKHPGRGEKYVRRSYPSTETEAFITGGFNVYPDRALDYLDRRTKPPILEGEVQSGKIVWRKSGRLKIWEKPDPDTSYVIGADVGGSGEGIGGANESAIEVFAHPGYRQVAEWSSEWIDPRSFAYAIKPIGEYFNNAIVAVEINNAGTLTNSELESIYGYVYKWKYFNRTGATRNNLTGWQTTHETKVIMVSHMNSLMSQSPPNLLIRSPLLLSQMRTFLDYGGDIYRPSPGTRGDLNMSALIACVCLWQEYARHDIDAFFNRAPEENKEPDYRGVMRDDWDPGDHQEGASHWLLL